MCPRMAIVTVAARVEEAVLPAVPASPTNAVSGGETASACSVFRAMPPVHNQRLFPVLEEIAGRRESEGRTAAFSVSVTHQRKPHQQRVPIVVFLRSNVGAGMVVNPVLSAR